MHILKPVLALLALAMLAQSTVGLAYAPGYFDFTAYVNESLLLAPRLLGYGADYWDPITGETRMWYEDWTGKLLVLDQMIHGKSPEATCRKALKEGYAKGYGKPLAILSPSSGGLGGWGVLARDYSDMSDVKVPAVDISIGIWLLAKGLSDQGYPTQLGLIVRDDDRTPPGWTFAGILISSAILTALCLSCFIVMGFKFRLHLLYTHGVTTAKIFFVLDLIANLMRFWYVAVNPFYMSAFDYTWTTICSATHVSLSIICSLLLALKWQELMLRSKLKVTLFLTTLKWPFIIAGTLIFLLEFISSALRGHWFDITKINQSSLSILLILAFLCSLLLFVSGAQIMCKISTAVGNRRRLLQLSRTTILIMISGLGLFLWAILEIVFLITIYAKHVRRATPFSIQMISVFQFAGLFLTSLLQNWAMPIPGDGKSNSSRNGDGTPRQGVVSGGKASSASTVDQITSVDTGIRAGSTDTYDSEEDYVITLWGGKQSATEHASDSNTPSESDDSDDSDTEKGEVSITSSSSLVSSESS